MENTKFSLEKALGGVPVRCREQRYIPTIERVAGLISAHALVGRVSSRSGSMQILRKVDGGAIRIASNIFSDSPDSDFDLLMVA